MTQAASKLSALTFNKGSITALEAALQLLKKSEGGFKSSFASKADIVLAQSGKQSLRINASLLIGKGGDDSHTVSLSDFDKSGFVRMYRQDGSDYMLGIEQFAYAFETSVLKGENMVLGYQIIENPVFYYADASGNRVSKDFNLIEESSLESLFQPVNDAGNHFDGLNEDDLSVESEREAVTLYQNLKNGGMLEWSYIRRDQPESFTVTYHAPHGAGVSGRSHVRLNSKQQARLENPLLNRK